MAREAATEEEWRSLADDKARSAVILFNAGQFVDSYSMLHLSMEAEIKALIARRHRFNSWPRRRDMPDVYSHDLPKLMQQSGFGGDFETAVSMSRDLRVSWKEIKDMQIGERYTIGDITREIAEGALLSANCPTNGVRTWLRNR